MFVITLLPEFICFRLIEPMEGATATVARADKLIKTGSNFFKYDREKDDGVVREVCQEY